MKREAALTCRGHVHGPRGLGQHSYPPCKRSLSEVSSEDNATGDPLPVLEHYLEETDSYRLTGLARGGDDASDFKRNNAKAVGVASLQTPFVTLDEAVKITKRRVNAAERVILPLLDAPLLVPSQSWNPGSETSTGERKYRR